MRLPKSCTFARGGAQRDPKITLFRDGGQVMLYNGYAGKVGAASAACSADLVIPNMVAEAASGQYTPREAAARAEQRAAVLQDLKSHTALRHLVLTTRRERHMVSINLKTTFREGKR